MNEDRASRYHRLRRRALVAGSAGTAMLLAALLLTGAAHALRDGAATAASLLGAPGSTAVTSAMLAIAVWILHDVLALPFSWYLGFSLEHRYGLSRQRLVQWARDHARASALSLVVFVASVVFVYWAIGVWSRGWWVLVWVAGVSASVALAWAAPLVLMPLFFTFRPLTDQSLRQRLTGLASRAGAPVLDVFEWRLSDRTRRGTAALTGLASTRRVIVSDTLVADYSPDEIEVVLAHELAHHVHRDLWKTLALDAVLMGMGLWAASLLLPAVTGPLKLEGIDDQGGLPFLLLLTLGWTVLSLPLANAVSRAHERRADAFALDLTGKPESFISALRRLAAQNLAEESPSAFARAFFATHPSFDERLAGAHDWVRRRSQAAAGTS